MGWHYIASMINPADIASRGTTPKQLSEHESWFKGPSFLWENNVTILNSNPLPDLDPDDAEVRKEKICCPYLTQSLMPRERAEHLSKSLGTGTFQPLTIS